METIGRNLDLLTAFQMVATEKSFTGAGLRLGRSKSLLSRQIKTLETYLGTTLFLRTTRSLGLTKEGVILKAYADRIFSISSDADRRLKDLTHGMSGTLKISTPVSLGLRFFPSFLRELTTMLPEVRLDADLSNENRDFAQDQIDFAIRATRTHPNDHQIHFLGRIKDVICGARGIGTTAASRRDLNDPEAILRHPVILYANDPTWNVWSFTSGLKKALQLKPGGKFFVNMYEAARSLCLDGLGIARLPRYCVGDELARGALVELFPKYDLLSHPLYLVYPRRDHHSEKHRVARDHIIQWFRKRKDLFL